MLAVIFLASVAVLPVSGWITATKPSQLGPRSIKASSRGAVIQRQHRNNDRRRFKSFVSSSLQVTSDEASSISTIDLGSSGKDNSPEDHERIGQELAESIERWLNSEWYPQEIHKMMGLSAKRSYIECRMSDPPQNDVMDILMKISLDLSDDWEEKYDADAFINPYDVGNYAADWLTKTLTDTEGCECSSELF